MRSRRRESFEGELAASALFAELSPDQVREVAQSVTRTREPEGMVFSKEGERGDELVVLLEGTVEVRREGAVLVQLGAGDHFGEMALLDDGARRSATVVAVTRVVVAYFSRRHFETLFASNPSVRLAVERALRERSITTDDQPDGA